MSELVVPAGLTSPPEAGAAPAAGQLSSKTAPAFASVSYLVSFGSLVMSAAVKSDLTGFATHMSQKVLRVESVSVLQSAVFTLDPVAATATQSRMKYVERIWSLAGRDNWERY